MTSAVNLYNGSNGAALTNPSGTFSWGAITLSPAGSALLSNGAVLEGTTSGRAADTCKEFWWGNFTTNPWYGRTYLFLTGTPQNGFAFAKIFGDTYTDNVIAFITTDRRLGIRQGAGGDEATELKGSGNEASTAASTVPTGQWFRVDWNLNTAGACTTRIYTGSNAHGTTPDATVSITPSGISTFDGSIVGLFSYDASAATRVFAPSGGYVYTDALATDSAAYPAPLPIASAALTTTASLSASMGSVAAATLTGTGTLDASAAGVFGAGSALTGTGSMSASLGAAADAALTTTAAATATVSLVVPVDAALTGTAGFTADGEVSEIVSADAALAGVGALSAGSYLDSEITPGYLFGSVLPNPVTGG